jgi:hypothetical protein
VQRTNAARAAKAAPGHARVRMGADIIERKDARARMTNENLAPANLASAHATFRQIDKSHGGLKKSFSHRGHKCSLLILRAQRAGVTCVTYKAATLKKRRCLATFVT